MFWNNFEGLEECKSVDETNTRIIQIIQEVGSKFSKILSSSKPQVLSEHTLSLM